MDFDAQGQTKAFGEGRKARSFEADFGKGGGVKFHDVVTLVGRRKTGRGAKEATCVEETTRGTIDLLAAMKKKTKKKIEICILRKSV